MNAVAFEVTPQDRAQGAAALHQVAKFTATTGMVFAGAILVALLAVSAPKYGVPLLILVALIMLVRANVKAKNGG